MNRIRSSLAHYLRLLARALESRADRIDPIKITLQVAPAESFAGRASREQAQAIIARAMHPTSLWGEQRAARR